VYGNLLTLPVGGGLLYVEPVYVQASTTTAFPLLRKVLVSFGDKIAFEDTLQAALDTVFAGESGVDTGEVPPPPGGTPTPTPTPTGTPAPGADNPALQAALADAQAALADADAALKSGDFAAYGRAQTRLQDAISRAVAAEAAAGRPGSGTASPTATPSPTP